MTLWSEPSGSHTKSTLRGEVGGSTEPAGFGETSYNSVRRFVIVRERKGHCLGV
jgi:hypothetical protein